MARSDVREILIDDLKKELMGPSERDEIINRIPTDRYVTGIVYPIIKDGSQKKEDDPDDRDSVLDEDEEIHTDVNLPCSMGISMIIAVDELGTEGVSIAISGATYHESKPIWTRQSISRDGELLKISNALSGIEFTENKTSGALELANIPGSIGESLNGLRMMWETSRLVDQGGCDERWYLSVSIVNQRRCSKKKKAQNCLYQTYLNVSTVGVHAIVARATSYMRDDEDMQSLSLLYRQRHEYGVGHVCSVNWDPQNDSDSFISSQSDDERPKDVARTLLPSLNVEETKSRCSAVESTYFPERSVKALDFGVVIKGETLSLGMYALSDEDYLEGDGSGRERNLGLLRALSNEYEEWIRRSFTEEGACPSDLKSAFDRNRKACLHSLERIREGIGLLEKDDEVYSAFCLMNRAIWLQFINKKKAMATAGPYVIDLSDRSGSWRPFQMGFILQIIPSIVDRRHPDRDVMDLLWVSTGAGKTEAYLGLVAFQLFYNRIKKRARSEDGVEVIMRYTLRLLTLQQFQRATRLILACEYIRLNDRYPILSGCKRFSIGLYVGQSMTPNMTRTGKKKNNLSNDYDLFKLFESDKDAYKDLEYCGTTAEYALGCWRHDGKLPGSSNPVQYLNCPWCGTPMKHSDFKTPDRAQFDTHCSNPRCCFHAELMPIHTVDDCIYAEPPSFLIGTVDKFAQLPFNEQMGALFGWRGGKVAGAPPSLIIQDELHLINGPLGSMVGLYEATMELMSLRGTRTTGPLSSESIENTDTKVIWDERPKLIASTATIRNSDAQCRQLYDRKAIKFPATGINISDSFFVRERSGSEDSKAYLGILCAGIGMKTALKRAVSKIMNDISIESTKRPLHDFDPYWTVVSYFNTKRELGGAVTLLRDDIRNEVEELRPTMMEESSIGELHGGLNSTELPVVLKRMETPAGGPNPYDVICCTNMFSVGVDVDRLGLMIMNSQPNATTEYLQATGRVGRSGDGLVLTLFNQARPRDQSHFERYYDYHARIQLHVESMTVTPYSEGSLDRALHAQYVAMMRHMFNDGVLLKIGSNTECSNFSLSHRNHPLSLMFMLFMIQRARTITKRDSARKNVTIGLVTFQEDWLRRIRDVEDVCRGDGSDPAFYYQQKSPFDVNVPRLMESDPASKWYDPNWVSKRKLSHAPIQTPNSLRNVEEEVDLVDLKVKQ